MLILGTGIVLMLVFLVLVGHHNENEALRQWEAVLNPDGAHVYAQVAEQVEQKRAMVERSYEGAARARTDGCTQEAVRLLELGGRLVEDCSPSLLRLLRNILVLSRHAAAIAPVPPLRPKDFRVVQLVTLAGVHRFGHHFLMTTRERLEFRLTVLRCGVKAAAGLLLRATRATIQAPSSDARWRRIEAVREDLGTLTEESLASLRVVLASLAAVQRPVAKAASKVA
jgi:hypothetical protein